MRYLLHNLSIFLHLIGQSLDRRDIVFMLFDSFQVLSNEELRLAVWIAKLELKVLILRLFLTRNGRETAISYQYFIINIIHRSKLT